eukprot:6471184-Amphidinium_carterae.1
MGCPLPFSLAFLSTIAGTADSKSGRNLTWMETLICHVLPLLPGGPVNDDICRCDVTLQDAPRDGS